MLPDAAGGVFGPELRVPGADRLVHDVDPTLSGQQFDLVQRERKPVVEPHTVRDDRGWKPDPLYIDDIRRSSQTWRSQQLDIARRSGFTLGVDQAGLMFWQCAIIQTFPGGKAGSVCRFWA